MTEFSKLTTEQKKKILNYIARRNTKKAYGNIQYSSSKGCGCGR